MTNRPGACRGVADQFRVCIDHADNVGNLIHVQRGAYEAVRARATIDAGVLGDLGGFGEFRFPVGLATSAVSRTGASVDGWLVSSNFCVLRRWTSRLRRVRERPEALSSRLAEAPAAGDPPGQDSLDSALPRGRRDGRNLVHRR